jgi:hypothetical protein
MMRLLHRGSGSRPGRSGYGRVRPAQSRRIAVKLIKASLLVGFALALTVTLAGDYEYIGAKKCKLCHKVQYTSWEETAHAKAFERLKPEEQGKEECLKCHATGNSADMPGVQCESCHGPGSGYKSKKTMEDRDAAVAAGLLVPNEETCRACHEGAPHDQPEFNYEEAKKTGLHAFEAEE